MIKIGIPLRYSHMEDGRCILYLSERVRRTIQKAGAMVVPLVQVQDVNYADTRFSEFLELTEEEKAMIDASLDMVDGVLFPGGRKITPYDVTLLKKCIEKDIPTLGICLGMQLMSSLDRDFTVELNDSSVSHNQEEDEGFSHKVKIDPNSRLFSILGKKEIMVNSFHRYHALPNPNYLVSATSEDGYIEAIEYPKCRFHIGVQWHPEISYPTDQDSQKIIHAFLEACRK